MRNFFRRFIDIGDYKKKDSWSIDRIQFEIDEIDKGYPFLKEIYEEICEEIIHCKTMVEKHLEHGNLDHSKDFSERKTDALGRMYEIEKQIGQNWERREELVKILRNKL
ncbi:hypothetical protein [Nostoc sp.]